MKKILIITAVCVVALAAAAFAVAKSMNKEQILEMGIVGNDPRPITLPDGAKLIKVSLRYHIAMNPEGSYTFTVKDLGPEEGYQLEIESPMYKEDEVFTTKISEEEFLAIKDVVGKLDLNLWNGYHKYNRDVLDGSSFSSSFVYSTVDGDNIYVDASGTNTSPDGYYFLRDGMEKLFVPYKKQYDYDRIPKVLKSDNLQSLYVTFKQRGKSGYNSYDFEFKVEPWPGGYNINARYLDYTGEFGAQMVRDSDRRTILVKDVENMDLSPIQKVIRKYNIAAINGYDVATEDYNNAEWFQISAGYSLISEKDSTKTEYESINIMGTEKFADYDAFRHDFLKACIEVADKYDK